LGRLVEALKAPGDVWPHIEFGQGSVEQLRFLISTNQDAYISLKTGRLGLNVVKDLAFEIFEANDLNLTASLLRKGFKKDLVSNVKNLSIFALDLKPFFKDSPDLQTVQPSIINALTPPFGLSWAGLEGFDFDFDGIQLAMESFSVQGPFEYLLLPNQASAKINGLAIDLSGTTNGKAVTVKQFLGSDKFYLNTLLDFSYSQETGQVNLTAKPLLADPDLFDLSLGLSLAGLTPELMTELSKITYAAKERALFMPGSDNLVLTEAYIKFDNKALAKDFFNKATSGSNRPVSELEATLNRRLNSATEQWLGKNLDSKRLLVSDLSMFIHKPDSLILASKPNPPLPVNKLLVGEALGSTTLNSMVISLATNGQSPIVLRWGDR
jgi:hypothetical protein